MKILEHAGDLRAAIAKYREQGQTIGFVPTMGNLHDGHLALVDAATETCDRVVVSIFVNPMQFAAGEDLEAYPRTPEDDEKALALHHVNILYRPRDEDIYPGGAENHTRVEVPGLSDTLCGLSRPGHFSGVATVVNKLFNLVQPDVAFFGKKDYQQYLVIQKMVKDLAMGLEIVGVDTVRLDSGLAMSSRNNYFDDNELVQAAALNRIMQKTVENYIRSPGDGGRLLEEGNRLLIAAGFRPDYFSVRCRADLSEPAAADRELILLAAAWLGQTRLIDNLEFTLPA